MTLKFVYIGISDTYDNDDKDFNNKTVTLVTLVTGNFYIKTFVLFVLCPQNNGQKDKGQINSFKRTYWTNRTNRQIVFLFFTGSYAYARVKYLVF